MNIRQKMRLGAVLFTLLPVVITSLLLWRGATNLTEANEQKQTEARLVALRDTKIVQVRDDLETHVNSLKALAAQRSTIDGFKQLRAGYATAAKDFASGGDGKAEMLSYLDNEFNREFAARNADAVPALAPIVERRSPVTAALQAAYITQNPNKLGEKDKLVTASGDNAYNRAHAAIHPGFERAQKLHGFYDLFLIDIETDTVVYSVFKELDFATSLTDGIAAKTKLDEVYRAVKQAANRDAAALSDFLPYLASYNDQAAFAAAPLFDGDKQVGVIVMQYPIDKITSVMSSGRAWKQIGLGETGDVFAVGPDGSMRSNARYMLEADLRPAFLEQIAGQMTPVALASLNKKQSTLGSVKALSEATQPALRGESGYVKFTDYRGVPSYGAYAPLSVFGLKWGVVAKIDQLEADEPVRELARSTLTRALLVGLGVLVVAGVGVSIFLVRFLRPIATLKETVQRVAAGETQARSRLIEEDEIGDLGRSFDQLLDDRIASLEKASKENDTLNNSVIALLQTVFQLSNKDLTARAPVTEDIIGTVSSSINQLSDETGRTLVEVRDIARRVNSTSAAVREQSQLVQQVANDEQRALESMSGLLGQTSEQLVKVASLSETSSRAANITAQSAQAAYQAVQDTVKGMDGLRDSISEMEKRFKRLGERSQEISTAVNLINTISERTHVLALNASMQAATAGEAGRGFAVVAEEVQRLSDSSRQATAQIAQLVGNIQAETNETIYTVNRLIGETVKQTESAQRAGVQMTQTQQATSQLVGLVSEIAKFSQQQAELAGALQQSVLDINQGTQRTSQAITAQNEAAQTLDEYANRLTDAVGQFTLPTPV